MGANVRDGLLVVPVGCNLLIVPVSCSLLAIPISYIASVVPVNRSLLVVVIRLLPQLVCPNGCPPPPPPIGYLSLVTVFS